ncbi:MAG: phosphate acyltransferase PlsX [Tissierellia bacterium]|nr:phosphate acyltransferase PlsX [Tissierellia bacterium]
MKLLLDAYGLDAGPSVVLNAGAKAKSNLQVDVGIIGPKSIEDEATSKGLEFVHAAEEISMNEPNPAFAIRQKRDSSISKGLRLVKDGAYHGFVSGGSTGALLAGGMTIVGRIPGIKRAALMAPFPAKNRTVFMLDIGANADCTSDLLYSFAVMAEKYLKTIVGIPHPSIMLLNNGTEEHKGSELTQETFKLLSQSQLNFKGNIEARYVFEGDCDIIVTDGFTGNIFLKTLEGVFQHFNFLLKDVAKNSWTAKIGLGLMYKPMKIKFASLDASKHGGVPLLGLKKTVVKAHGSSDMNAFYNSIVVAKKTIESGMIDELEKSFSKED